MEVPIQATIDDLNQYLQGNVTAIGLIDTLQDMIEFLKDSEGIYENKEFDFKKYISENRLLNETMDVKSANDMQDEMVKSFGRDDLMGAAKLEIVGADKSEVKDAAELGRMTLQNMLSAIFKKYGPNFSSVTEKGKLSITPQSKEGGALGYSFVITQ